MASRGRVAREDGAARADTRRERCGDDVGTGRRRRGRGETARARAARHASARPRWRGLGPRPTRGGWARPAGPRRHLARAAKPTAEPTAHRRAIDAKWRERPRTPRASARPRKAEARGRCRRGERANGEHGKDDAKNTTKKTTQVLDIHGRQKQQKRTSTFFEFCRATSGVLLCTDVAARGLDIPEVNWIVQFDPPV